MQSASNLNVGGPRVLVVGDVMLDRYWFGDVDRISPEAPVPVVRVSRTEERPGGASNVARNAAALGARMTLLSVVGRDDAGASLRRLMAEGGIDASLHEDEAFDTIVKLRVISRQQQLLRIDFETAPSHEVLAAKLAEFAERVADCDAVILSDYGSCTTSPTVKRARGTLLVTRFTQYRQSYWQKFVSRILSSEMQRPSGA